MSNKGKIQGDASLLAVVITAIVLLILAGIVVTIVVNGSNTFEKSGEPKTQLNNSISKEEQTQKTLSAPTDIIKVRFTDSSLIVKAKGGSAYKYKVSSSNTWSKTVPDGTEYEIKGLAKGETYTVQAICAGEYGAETEIKEVEMKVGYEGRIGEYVHYNVPLDVGDTTTVDDDWIIFYEDWGNKITYLIAADCVPNSNATLTTAMMLGDYTNVEGKSKGIYKGASKDTIDKNVATRFLVSWHDENRTLTAYKHKAMATMLSPEVWDGFVLKNEEGTAPFDSSIQAIGTPTIDLWVASWNQKGYTPIYLAIKPDAEAGTYGNGYYMGTLPNPTGQTLSSIKDFAKTGYKGNPLLTDKVYYPQVSSDYYCLGYWLASPNSSDDEYRMSLIYWNDEQLYSGGIMSNLFNSNSEYGFRPVVSLSTDLIGKDSSSEIYYLGTNINL